MVSAACALDADRRAACHVIEMFFRAVNSRRFPLACSLLGNRLRAETGGVPCPRFLAMGVPEAVPWGILGARRTDRFVAVRVELGQWELDHIRMREHRAYVALEDGALRIVETKLVR